jgi:hypothetical protein
LKTEQDELVLKYAELAMRELQEGSDAGRQEEMKNILKKTGMTHAEITLRAAKLTTGTDH